MCSNIYDELQILKLVDLSETEKYNYLEKETLFFLQIKRFIHHTMQYQKLKWYARDNTKHYFKNYFIFIVTTQEGQKALGEKNTIAG